MSQGIVEPRLIYDSIGNLPLLAPRFVDLEFFKNTSPFSRWITEQRWEKLFGLNRPAIPDLVKEFYENLCVPVETAMPDYLSSKVCGRLIVITPTVLSEILAAPLQGTEIRRHDDIYRIPDYPANYLLLDGNTQDDGIRANRLPKWPRLLHYMIEEYIYPKTYWTNWANALDRCIIWHVLENRPLNLPVLLMKYLSTRNSYLGLGSLITHILICQGVPYSDALESLQGPIIDRRVLDHLDFRFPAPPYGPRYLCSQRHATIDAAEPSVKKLKHTLPGEEDSAKDSSEEEDSFYDSS